MSRKLTPLNMVFDTVVSYGSDTNHISRIVRRRTILAKTMTQAMSKAVLYAEAQGFKNWDPKRIIVQAKPW